ncbi:ABC transporter ATP-binding protein [Cellulomonas cellasea]|uniref:Peptide ABC transporter ATP-binding protein n=2 Tax=Cellulomonas cellasea TaxID=43670 RepID=A0A0A0B528_9CELL|nr:ABC transporter ATP-binding protein [Cellulomonas cellasea]KGM00909.1 peptide ABC transporter ATP-binding protein [Cellulomonas cellasea DSM 20118]GEA87208.1 peptide ABC transporter ATP-binding protein [Cellulomonas cellasea]
MTATSGTPLPPLVELRGVTRDHGHPPVRALDDVTLSIGAGAAVAVVGPSGSGKSTLLNLLGTLDRPSHGQVVVDGADVASLDDDDLSALRAHRIGFVFQQFHLTEGIGAVDAVADGLLYTGTPLRARRQRALDALELVGLAGRARHRPNQLSGGERQRVAIARAVVGSPALLLADEPTGNLDSANGAAILELLLDLHRAGTALVVITHDPALAARLPRQVTLQDGRLLADVSTTEGAPA